MYSVEQVKAIIRKDGYPYWKLQSKKGYSQPTEIGQHMPAVKGKKKPADDEEEIEDKVSEKDIEGSIELLDATIALHCQIPDLTFIIRIYKNRTASGSGILGPFEFTLNGQAQGNVISSTAHSVDHFGHYQRMLSEQMEVERQKNVIALDRLAFSHEKEKALLELAKKEQELKEAIAENAELEKKYLSDIEVMKAAIEHKGMGLIREFMTGKKETPSIGSVEAGAVKPIPPTEQERLVEEIAGAIHANVKDPDEIRVLGIAIHDFIKNPAEPHFDKFRAAVKNSKQV